MYSSAFNNNLIGTPDPHTGTYSFKFNLASFKSCYGFGPEFNLNINFNHLATFSSSSGQTQLLGMGWSFNFSIYDSKSEILTLSDGRSYQVLEKSGISSNWKLAHKTQDINVFWTEIGNTIEIQYKDGTREILSKYYSNNIAIFRLVEIISSSGRSIKFSYHSFLLYDIKDDSNTSLATIEHTDNNTVTSITLYPNSNEERKYTLSQSSITQLQSIKLPNNSAINFEYTDEGTSGKLWFISKVTYPTGAEETISYKNKLRLPLGSGFESTPMPALSKYTKRVSTNGSDISMDIIYGENNIEDNNYWGNNALIEWSDNEDQLYNYPNTYYYSNTITIGNKTIKSTYNKFHQLIESIETNGSDLHQKITSYTYYSNDEGVLDEQPLNYEFPKSKVVTFSPDESKEFKEYYIYDDWGNKTQTIEVSGVTTNTLFYSEMGEPGCPAHPFEMRAFVKQKEIVAANNDGATKETLYTYKEIKTSDPTFNWVSLDTKTFGDYTLTHQYYDNTSTSDANLIGQLKSTSVSYDDNEKKESILYSYTLNTENLIVTTKFTGFDSIITTEEKTYSRWKLLLQSETDIEGIITSYEYDVLGRSTQQTNAFGSDYEVIISYEYHYLPDLLPADFPENETNRIGTQIIQTSQNTISHSYKDGEDNDLTSYISDKNDALYKISEITYDNLSRKSNVTQWDYILNKSDTEPSENFYSSSIDYQYGFWGEVNKETYSDGVVLIREMDPTNLTLTEHVEDVNGTPLPKIVTTYDHFQNILTQERLTSTDSSYSKKSNTYDGFGNLKQTLSPLQNSFSIDQYDLFDRPTAFTHFDGGSYQIDYFEGSNESMPKEVKIINAKPEDSDPISLGTLSYDSLSRVTSQTNQGITKAFDYESTNFGGIPNTITNGRKQICTIETIKELGRVSKVKTYSDSSLTTLLSSSSFSFSNKTNTSTPIGSLTNTTSDIGSYDYIYYKNGALNNATQHIEGFTDKLSSLESYTLAGTSLNIKVGDRIINKELDSYGRLQKTTDSTLEARSTFDKFGRVQKVDWYGTSDSLKVVQTITLEYDDYGREKKRTVTIPESTTNIVIEIKYDIEDKIILRTTTLNTSKTLIEHFEYDEKSRLKMYYVDPGYSEELLATDSNGKKLTNQEFTYNVLNNLTTLASNYSDSTSETKTFTYIMQKLDHLSISGDSTKEIDFTYDQDGNLISGDQNNNINYNVFNQVSKYNDTDYLYDSRNQIIKIGNTIGRYYLGYKGMSEISNGNETNFLSHGKVAIGEELNGETKILSTDNRLSVIGITQNGSTNYTSYTPLGVGNNTSRKKFNGELSDDSSGGYMLGNGTRLYLTDIGVFTSLDSYAPFNGGGLNPYRYCNGDSINYHDSSGHFIVALLTGISVATGIASTVLAVTDHDRAAKITGVISAITGLATGVKEGKMVFKKILNHPGIRKIQRMENGQIGIPLSGRGQGVKAKKNPKPKDPGYLETLRRAVIPKQKPIDEYTPNRRELHEHGKQLKNETLFNNYGLYPVNDNLAGNDHFDIPKQKQQKYMHQSTLVDKGEMSSTQAFMQSSIDWFNEPNASPADRAIGGTMNAFGALGSGLFEGTAKRTKDIYKGDNLFQPYD